MLRQGQEEHGVPWFPWQASPGSCLLSQVLFFISIKAAESKAPRGTDALTTLILSRRNPTPGWAKRKPRMSAKRFLLPRPALPGEDRLSGDTHGLQRQTPCLGTAPCPMQQQVHAGSRKAQRALCDSRCPRQRPQLSPLPPSQDGNVGVPYTPQNSAMWLQGAEPPLPFHLRGHATQRPSVGLRHPQTAVSGKPAGDTMYTAGHPGGTRPTLPLLGMATHGGRVQPRFQEHPTPTSPRELHLRTLVS